jgi:hypothetical protein
VWLHSGSALLKCIDDKTNHRCLAKRVSSGRTTPPFLAKGDTKNVIFVFALYDLLPCFRPVIHKGREAVLGERVLCEAFDNVGRDCPDISTS